MSRDPRLNLEDILVACDKIQGYMEAVTREGLMEDTMRFDAVVRNLELIGEAAGQVPQPVRDALPQAPWREMVAMRNILIHAYFGVDPDVVWTAASQKVAPLADAVGSTWIKRMTDSNTRNVTFLDV